MTDEIARKSKRARSPNYPSTPLKEAIERARTLHKKETHHPAPVEAILGHWKYSPKSGPGWSVLASLKKFGLIIYGGKGPTRTARLSDNALAIIIDKREVSEEREAAIRKAALTPPLHTKLLEAYGGTLPSDDTLMYELQRNYSFTESGAKEFIRQFRSTLAFAGLANGGMIPSEEEDSDTPGVNDPMAPLETLETPPATPPGKQATKVVQIPIAANEWAALQAPFPLTKEKWQQMFDVLKAMKPALVAENGAEADEDRPEPTKSD